MSKFLFEQLPKVGDRPPQGTGARAGKLGHAPAPPAMGGGAC